MATIEQIEREIESRINTDIKHFKGSMPERYALAWNGYLAGLYEWGFIERYNYLVNLLPKIDKPDPILEIFEGREDEDEE